MSIFRIPLDLSKKLARTLAPDLYVRARARFRAIVGPAGSRGEDPRRIDLERRIDAFDKRVARATSDGRIEPAVAARLQRFVSDLRADMAEDRWGLR